MNYRDFIKQVASGKTTAPIKLRSGITQGFVKSKPLEGPSRLPDRPQLGFDYVQKYRLQEELKQETEDANQLEEVEGLTSVAGTIPNPDDVFSEQFTQVYDIYSFKNKNDGTQLKIHDYKDKILDSIELNSVVLIKGHTGCGKSTQVPQMILDNAAQSNIHCNIVVTQPRRIATISVARRVALERGWGIGTLVGYQISLEKKVSPDTRLLYCTTGVLLHQLINDQSLSKYTHIIVDEVHERDMETDFLLILIKLFMKRPSCRTKVILMSATVNTEKFTDYFTKRMRGGALIVPPIIEMPKLNQYIVYTYYLEDLKSGRMPMKIPDFKYEEPTISEAMYQLAVSLVEVFHTIDSYEVGGSDVLGSVLIFLPGIYEITCMCSCLEKKNMTRKQDEQWWIRPLHSSVTFEEQTAVFKPAPPNHRKIILATNIAESSITVPDAKYVIDFCLMKFMKQEPDSGYSSLQMGWMSKSQGDQRSGRIGRCGNGRVYRLIPNSLYKELDEECEPEITRSPLDVPVLKAKQLSPDDPPAKILSFAMDPPDLTNIHRTILKLKQIGALTTYVKGEFTGEDGDLTYIGQVMASLPIDIALSKLIIMGHSFSLLSDAIIIACAMQVRSIFSSPFRKQLEAYNSRIAWADSSCSDPIAFKIAYEVWRKKKTSGYFNRSEGLTEQDVADRYYIQLKSLKEMSRLEEDIIQRLRRLNIVEQVNPTCRWNDMEKPLILKIMIAGAFYPNYFLRRPADEKEAVKILGGRDPFSTCFLTGFPLNQPGPLYANAIKNYFTHCGSSINVSFDGSSKVYLEFKSSATDIDSLDNPAMMPGYIQMALYRAIKLRQLKKVISIPILPHREANNRWAKISSSKEDSELNVMPSRKNDSKVKSHLPGCTTEILNVNISHKENPSKFWVQIADETYQKRLVRIFTLMNENNCSGLIPIKKQLQIGMLVAAPFSENKKAPSRYYRARIRNFGCGRAVQVFFIDYGNLEWVEGTNLLDFHQNLLDSNITEDPEIAMECTLTEVQPSVMSNRNGLWSDKAVLEFDKYFRHDPVAYAKIYSIVNGVISVILFRNRGCGGQVSCEFEDSFNFHLIKNGFADRCEEPYLSRNNHLLREEATKRPDLAQAYTDTTSMEDPYYEQSPKESECYDKVILKGPKSPLEMQLFCMTQKCMNSNVMVDWTSVNSVLLDTYPMDPHERILVAGLVNQSANGEKLILRETTLMPNIHGLFAIIALIFSPYVELRVDSERTRWTGALCGLGCDPITHASYDPENDMEINFDVLFTLEDLENINRLRYWMNVIVFGGMDWKKEVSKGHITDAPHKIKSLLTKILLKKRPSQGVLGHGENFKWGIIDEKHLMDPMEDNDSTSQSLYPLIWAVRLKKASSVSNVELAKSLDKLTAIINGVEQLRTSTVCGLCHVHLDDVQSVKFHVSSSMHCEALSEYQKNISSRN